MLDPVLVTVTVLLKTPPENTNAPVVAVIAAPNVVPANVALVPVALNVPLLHAPLLATATPVDVKVKPLRFSVPELMVQLVMLVLALKVQTLDPVTITTWSVVRGIPEGVQLEALAQAVETEPFQVRVVWASNDVVIKANTTVRVENLNMKTS